MKEKIVPQICFVADAADIHTQRWAKYFADNGYQVHVISRRTSSNMAEDINLHWVKSYGIKIPVLRYIFTPLFYLIQLRKMLKIIKPNIIHCFGIQYDTYIVALIGFHPLVVFPWGELVLIGPKPSMLARYMYKFSLKRADVITCDGENMIEAVVELGIDKRKIKKIVQGVDVDKFTNLSRDGKLRERLGLDDSPTVISTRRFGTVHDIITIAEAIPLVLEKIPEAKFVFIGEGEEKESVIARVKELKVSEATRFVGMIPHDELPGYLISSDVHVSTSVSDSGLSIATAEAMVCGLPVIVTDFGDNRSWVEDGINGFVIPPKDHNLLSEKLIYLLGNKNTRAEFGRKNRQIIEERNNYSLEMKKMDSIYREVIGK